MQTYAFGIPKWIIHGIHLLVGLFLVSTGNDIRMSRPMATGSKNILAGLGLISALYQAFLWIRGGRDFYSYNLPAWVVHTIHILNGLILLSLGSNLFPLSTENAGLYLIIVGALAAFYHLHLWVWG